MKKGLLLFSLIMMATCWYSCTKDTAPSPTAVQTGNCDTSKVNYTLNIVPIINAHCLGSACHSSSTSQTDYTSFVNVKSNIDQILCRTHAQGVTICSGPRMPQGQPALPDSVTAQFSKWKNDNFYDCH